MIQILFTYFDSKLPGNIWDYYLQKVPKNIRERISRYRRWEDRQLGLFGKMLLLDGLGEYGYRSNCLDNLSYNKFGRPFLDNSIDFNVSHAGRYVVCAISDRGKVGIDIEKIRLVELADFERYMTDEEKTAIRESDRQYETFYEYWTKKESVVKADGRGLSISLKNISISGKSALLDNGRYFLVNIDNIDASYKCHLAVSFEEPEIRIKEVFY